jgi:uncharacterized membrane protein
MERLEKTVVINAPVEKVFSYLEDPNNGPEWIPGMVETREVTGSGVGKHYHWTYKMAGMRFDGETTITEQVENERIVYESKGGISSIWTHTFQPSDSGTRFKMAIEYTIPVPVLGKLAEKLVLKRNEREADLAMENLKERLEGGS